MANTNNLSFLINNLVIPVFIKMCCKHCVDIYNTILLGDKFDEIYRT